MPEWKCPGCGQSAPDAYLICPSCGGKKTSGESNVSPPTGPSFTSTTNFAPPPKVQASTAVPAAGMPLAPSGVQLQGSASSAQYAGFWVRLAAHLVDSLLLLLAQYSLFFILSFAFMNVNIGQIMATGLAVFLGLFYEAFFYSSKFHATPGKMALRLVVLRDNGEFLNFFQGLARSFLKLFSVITLGIGFLMIAMTEKKQGLHDLMGGTFVMRR